MSERRRYNKVHNNRVAEIGKEGKKLEHHIQFEIGSLEDVYRKPSKKTHPLFSKNIDEKLHQIINSVGGVAPLTSRFYEDNIDVIMDQLIYPYSGKLAFKNEIKNKKMIFKLSERDYEEGDFHSLNARQIEGIVGRLQSAIHTNNDLKEAYSEQLKFYKGISEILISQEQLRDYSIESLLTKRARSKNKIGNKFEIEIQGGQTAHCYKAVLKFEKTRLKGRIVRSCEFSEEVWEKTIYSYINPNSESQ